MAKYDFQTLPSNLAWCRSVDVSEGLLSSVLEDGTLRPVEVLQTTVRGAIASSNAGYDKSGNPLTGATLEKAQNPENPNIQRIHVAYLDPASNTLSIKFAMGIHGASLIPQTCNSRPYAEAVEAFVSAAKSSDLYAEITERQIWALANGGVFWRNGIGIDKTVHVEALAADGEKVSCVFTTSTLQGQRGKLSYPGFDLVEAADQNGNALRLSQLWAKALMGGGYLSLEIDARVRLFSGAEVWPSQEFKEKDDSKNGLSRTLSFREILVEGRTVNHATMHSQKLGNALRTIDDWHGSKEYGALSVEAFGWYQTDSKAVRTGSGGRDAYSLLRDLPTLTKSLESNDGASRNDALYVLSVLLRGGVYGMSGKKDES